jgi:TPR repeat protein
MSKDIKNQNLIDDINSGKIILWIGSGYSRRLGFPDWKGFISKLAEKYFENEPDKLASFKLELYQDGCDLLSIMERFEKDKREPIFKIIPEIFKLPYSDPNDSRALPYKKLWRLSDKIITTNYDLSLNEAKDTDCRTIVWNRKTDYKNFVERSEKYLFKIHGTIKDPKNCIVFKDQYDEVYCSSVEENHEKETFYFLRHLITDHRILFIGYGGFDDDFYIDSTFEYVFKIISSFSDKKHYILKHKNSKINRDYLESIDFEDYNQLDSIIDELLNQKRTYSATSDQIDSYIPVYIGRGTQKDELIQFLRRKTDNFLFIWGRGGMGKTHLLKTVLDEINIPFLYYKLNATTTLQSLSEHLNLGIVIDNSIDEEFSISFINAIKSVNRLIIFDDFYEIDTKENPNPKLRKTLLQLKDSKNNKVIILSRVLDTTFSFLPELKIDFLTPEEHTDFINTYIKYKGEHLHLDNLDEIISKIWNASRGYPLVSEILLDILGQPYRYPNFDLDNFGSFDYEKYDKENNEGKEYLDKLISVVLDGKDEKSREFLLNFSIGLKEIPIELLEKLPESIQFKAEQRRKDFIIINEYENKRYTFTLHPLIWELLRKKAGNRPEVQLIFGNYYLNQFINNFDNIEAYNLAEYHFNLSTIEGLNSFNEQVKKIIDTGNVRDILSNNIEATIVRLTLKRNYSNNATINHQLAIQYYLLKKYEKAMQEIENGLKESVGDDHLLLYKAIIYKELKNFIKTEEALLEILNHNRGNVHARNEIGILYREWANEKRGDEKEKKYKQAEEWLKPLAEEKNILARNEIGILYREWGKEKRGAEKEAKFEQAEKWLKPLAEEENILARNEIGMLYREWAKEKRGAEKEAKYKQAEEWLKPLAETKDIIARNEIGMLYREWAKEKRGAEKEAKYKQAEGWLKPIAETKDIIARNEIGILYREWAKENRGDENEAKYKQAEDWLKPLAEEKHVPARNEIGILYREWGKEKRGDEKEAKFEQAEKWLKPLAEEKHVHARNEIGILYREWGNEKRGDEKEAKYKQAEKWLKPLAKEENFMASNELSMLYRYWGSENYKIIDKIKIELSKEWYIKTIKLKVENIQSYDGLCRVLILLKEYEECQKWGNEALKFKPYDSRILKIMVDLFFYYLHDNKMAIEYFNRVPDTFRNKEYIEKWKRKFNI